MYNLYEGLWITVPSLSHPAHMHVEVSESSAKGAGVGGGRERRKGWWRGLWQGRGHGQRQRLGWRLRQLQLCGCLTTSSVFEGVSKEQPPNGRTGEPATVGTHIACCTHTTHGSPSWRPLPWEAATASASESESIPNRVDIVPLKSAFLPKPSSSSSSSSGSGSSFGLRAFRAQLVCISFLRSPRQIGWRNLF